MAPAVVNSTRPDGPGGPDSQDGAAVDGAPAATAPVFAATAVDGAPAATAPVNCTSACSNLCYPRATCDDDYMPDRGLQELIGDSYFRSLLFFVWGKNVVSFF